MSRLLLWVQEKFNSTLKPVVISALILTGVVLYHMVLVRYSAYMTSKGEQGIDMSLIGNSLAVLCLLVFIYCIVQSSRQLGHTLRELQLQRHAMSARVEEIRKNRISMAEVSRQQAVLEVTEAVRMLADNLAWHKKTKVEHWVVPSRNTAVKANLTRLIEFAMEVLLELSRSESELMKKFAQEILDLNSSRLAGKDLSGLTLEQIRLVDAKLEGTNLSKSNLAGASLVQANLRGVNFTNANLSGANLAHADIHGANFTNANLSGADLTGAYLTSVDLVYANLTGANLAGAYLTGVDFTGANMLGADLVGAVNLTAARLSQARTLYNTKLPPAIKEEIFKTLPHLFDEPAVQI